MGLGLSYIDVTLSIVTLLITLYNIFFIDPTIELQLLIMKII